MESLTTTASPPPDIRELYLQISSKESYIAQWAITQDTRYLNCTFGFNREFQSLIN